MTISPPTACSTPFCSGLAVPGTHRCADCTIPAPAAEPLPTYRDAYAHLHGLARWRKPITGLSDCIIRRDPICKVCNRNPSRIADHIVDHRGNLQLFWDPKNLRGVCKPCHDRKTGRMHGRGRQRTEIKPPFWIGD